MGGWFLFINALGGGGPVVAGTVNPAAVRLEDAYGTAARIG